MASLICNPISYTSALSISYALPLSLVRLFLPYSNAFSHVSFLTTVEQSIRHDAHYSYLFLHRCFLFLLFSPSLSILQITLHFPTTRPHFSFLVSFLFCSRSKRPEYCSIKDKIITRCSSFYVNVMRQY